MRRSFQQQAAQTVAQGVRRINEAAASIDPGMVHSPVGGNVSEEEITEVVAIQREGNHAEVEVRLRSLAPKPEHGWWQDMTPPVRRPTGNSRPDLASRFKTVPIAQCEAE